MGLLEMDNARKGWQQAAAGADGGCRQAGLSRSTFTDCLGTVRKRGERER
jgi:hypothetical protein